MKRLQLIFALWMVLVAATMAQVRPAEVVATYRDGSSVRGYRLGDECFVPIDRLSALGIDAVLRGNFVDAKVGEKTTSLPYRTFSGSQSVPIKRLVETFGGVAQWDASQNRLLMLNTVVSVEAESGQIRLNAALPLSPATLPAKGEAVTLTGFKNPDKPVRGKTYRIEAGNPWPALVLPGKNLAARVSANAANVVAWADQTTVPKPDPMPANPPVTPPVNPVTPDPVEVPKADPPLNPPSTVANTFPDAEFNLSLDIEGPTSSLLTLKLGAEATRQPNLKALDPNYAEIEISGLNGHLPDDFVLPTTLIKQANVDATETGSIIRLWFTEPLGVEFWKSGSDFQIQLLRPGLHGTLAGKTVVIDAGHGDHDSGAQFGGVQEKNLTLAVAKKLALEMSAAGAKVIMTRTDDTFIELTDRAKIANSAKADLFISVHINSSAKVSMSGTITFYSGPNAIKELLARCIQTEIAAVSGLPGIGAWSDKRIYATKGFSVLRNTTMPGVLVELGFINHPRDRARMVTPEFQSVVAKAIVRGVRKFLGDGVKQ